MVKWKLKGCPRCGGDVYIDRDMDGWYEQCLLCAHRRELKELNPQRNPVTIGAFDDED